MAPASSAAAARLAAKAEARGSRCERQPEPKRLEPRNLAAGDRPHRRTGHDGVDIGVVPHVEGAGGASARGNCENGDKGMELIEVSEARCSTRRAQ